MNAIVRTGPPVRATLGDDGRRVPAAASGAGVGAGGQADRAKGNMMEPASPYSMDASVSRSH
jgi:hypothetical protein